MCFLDQTFHKHWLDSPWSGFFEGKDPLHVKDTGVHEETLTHIAKRCEMFSGYTEMRLMLFFV